MPFVREAEGPRTKDYRGISNICLLSVIEVDARSGS
jgi:hypothetical protein